MKVGFTGAGGTGKSTTLDMISGDLDIPVLKSTVRNVFEKWNIVETDQENMSPKDIQKLQFEMLNERIKNELSHKDGFLSDRTTLDHFAYINTRCHSTMSKESYDSLKKLVIDNLKSYDMIFYFPITFLPTPDGVRQANYVHLRIVDDILFSFMCREGIDAKVVPSGTPETRAEYVKSRIETRLAVKKDQNVVRV